MAFIQIGIKRGLPVVFGYIPLGFAFGVLAIQSGIPAVAAVCMSIFVFAGSGQYIATAMWGAGASVVSIVLTTFVVNLRHLLMSASLAQWLSKYSTLQRILFGLEIVDETFALHSSAMRMGEKAEIVQLYATNVTAHLGWVVGGTLGVLAGDLLPNPKLYGLDYALPAMFLALIAPQCRDKLQFIAAIFSGMISIVFILYGVGRWNVILSTLITATLGTMLVLWRNKKKHWQEEDEL